MLRRRVGALAIVAVVLSQQVVSGANYALTRIEGFSASGLDNAGRLVLTDYPNNKQVQSIWDSGDLLPLPSGISWGGSASGPLSGAADIYGSTSIFDQAYVLRVKDDGGHYLPSADFAPAPLSYVVNVNSIPDYARSQYVTDINSHGISVGTSTVPVRNCSECGESYYGYGSRWSGTQFNQVSDSGVPLGVNELGEMVGWNYFGDDYATRPARWSSSGALTVLPAYLNSSEAVLTDVNDNGVAVGGATRNGRFPYFVHANGSYQTLGLEGLSFYYSTGLQLKLNNRGQVMATGRRAGSSSSTEEPFLITPKDLTGDGVPDDWTNAARPLRELVPVPSGVSFTVGYGPAPVPDINNAGQIAGSMVVNGQYATYRLTPFNKFKQFQGGWASAFTDPYIVRLDAWTMSAKGCVITNLATVATYYGNTTDPLAMRNYLLDSPAEENQIVHEPQGIGVRPENFVYRGDGLVVAGHRGPNRGLDTIVSELRRGRPLMLAVPSASTNGPRLPEDGQLHYVTAYGLDPRLKSTQAWTPTEIGSMIYISDPGYGKSVYGEVSGWSAADLSEEKVNIKLADYFNYFKDGRVWGGEYDIASWFGFGETPGGKIIRNGSVVQMSTKNRAELRGRLITTFGAAETEDDIRFTSDVTVHSPVELRLFSSDTGKFYASSDIVALPGDIILYRSGFDNIAPSDEDGAPAVASSIEEFPPYTLYLPNELIGKALNVEIIGVGNGSYSVELNTRSKSLLSSGPLSGMITTGERVLGHFDVVPVPEPTSSICTVVIAVLALRTPSMRIQYGRAIQSDKGSSST